MKSAFTLLVCITHYLGFGQSEMGMLIDDILDRARMTSMYTSYVDWDSLQHEVHLAALGANSVQELAPAFTVMLNGIGDMHGKVVNAKDYNTIASFTDYDKLNHPDKRERKTEVWSVINDPKNDFVSQILPGNIGYLRIVGIPPHVNIDRESQRIRDAVIELAELNVEGWIIDLRFNGGGNMNPMISGIAPLIGDGHVGSLTTLNGQKIFDWEIREADFIYGGAQYVDLKNEPKFTEAPKIAVLTSRYTVSSGELVATCLKGRPNTRFFGEATGSLTSNNGWDVIRDEVILVISTGVFCDRNGISYRYNIPVDVEMPFEITPDLQQDETVIAACQWLK